MDFELPVAELLRRSSQQYTTELIAYDDLAKNRIKLIECAHELAGQLAIKGELTDLTVIQTVPIPGFERISRIKLPGFAKPGNGTYERSYPGWAIEYDYTSACYFLAQNGDLMRLNSQNTGARIEKLPDSDTIIFPAAFLSAGPISPHQINTEGMINLLALAGEHGIALGQPDHFADM